MEYKGNLYADMVNDFVNELDPKESRMPHRAMMGESYVATFVQVFGDEVHPSVIAGLSTAVIGGVIAFRIWTTEREPAGSNTEGLGLAARLER